MDVVVDYDYLKHATYMSLSYTPKTDQAKAFVTSLATLLKTNQTRQRKLKEQDELQFDKTVALIIGDLLLAHDEGIRSTGEKSNNGLSYHPMSANYFTDLIVGYEMFYRIVHGLNGLGLIEIYDGKNSRPIDWGEGVKTYFGGLATRFKPLQPLLVKAAEHGLPEEAYHEHFHIIMPTNVVEVRASKEPGGKRGKKMKLSSFPRFQQIINDITAINDFLSTFIYEGMVFTGLRRLFNEGDRSNFDFNLGGRLYPSGSLGYMGMNSQERASITINEEAIVEIDINASYLTILHALKGIAMPDEEDMYAIGGLPREVVKKWFSITLGSDAFHTRWVKGNVAELKEAEVAYKSWMTVKAVEKVVLEHFPLMRDWPKQEVRWSNLMFIESEVIISTMQELMLKHQVPSLPVHDCIIVRKSDQDLAMRVLSEQFKIIVGIKPRLKVKRHQ
jgi:hypothetical protein